MVLILFLVLSFVLYNIGSSAGFRGKVLGSDVLAILLFMSIFAIGAIFLSTSKMEYFYTAVCVMVSFIVFCVGMATGQTELVKFRNLEFYKKAKHALREFSHFGFTPQNINLLIQNENLNLKDCVAIWILMHYYNHDRPVIKLVVDQTILYFGRKLVNVDRLAEYQDVKFTNDMVLVSLNFHAAECAKKMDSVEQLAATTDNFLAQFFNLTKYFIQKNFKN